MPSSAKLESPGLHDDEYLEELLSSLSKAVDRSTSEAEMKLYQILDSEPALTSRLVAEMNKMLGVKASLVMSYAVTSKGFNRTLQRAAEELQCDLEVDDVSYPAAKPLFKLSPIVIRTDRNCFITFTKKLVKETMQKEYYPQKTKLKAEICTILKKLSELRFKIQELLAHRKSIDLGIVDAHTKSVKSLREKLKQLQDLKAKHDIGKTSNFVRSLEEVVSQLEGEIADIGGPKADWDCLDEFNKLVKVVRSSEEEEDKKSKKEGGDTCCECMLNQKRIQVLACKHCFCRDCLRKSLRRAREDGLLPKCPLPGCFALLSEEERAEVSKSEFDLSLKDVTHCILCGKEDGPIYYEEGRKHGMCGGCLRGYVEHSTQGRVFVLSAETKEAARPQFDLVGCPVPGCTRKISLGDVLAILPRDEVFLLAENAIEMAGLGLEHAGEVFVTAITGKKLPERCCYVKDCESSDPATLCGLRKCPATCELFVCRKHERRLAGKLRANAGTHPVRKLL